MKEIRLTIAIPTAGLVRMEFAYSLAGLVTRFAKEALPSRPNEKFHATISVAAGSVIHANRENLVQTALSAGSTHILFLDDDMEFDGGVANSLFSRKQPVIVTNYLIKNKEKNKFVALDPELRERISTLASSTGITPIGYSGFGVSLFETQIFRKIPQPWFLPRWEKTVYNKYTTEDYPFFEKLRENGIPCYLDQDASKLIRHLGNSSWSWEAFNGVTI
jgi:hypothetical protein